MRRRADPVELAWAAGFFDGEGSTIARRDRSRPGYRQLVLSVPQAGADNRPEVLVRFERAMLGMGSTAPRNDDGVYRWRTHGYGEARAALAMLWRHLGPVKRRQAAAALAAVHEQYASGRVARRPPRSRSRVPPFADRRAAGQRDDALEARAWAAGFLDAEGCFGVARNGIRSDGVPYYRIRCSASQHGDVASPPPVLVRLMAVLGDLGRIERHGEPDDYKWVIEGGPGVERVLAVVLPWLGTVKRRQATKALAAFAAQAARRESVRGDQNHCKRGHPYDRRVTRNRGTYGICNACHRLMERRHRAAQGIAPRQFKNIARRYTE